jgi:CBS domain-containing protein
MTTNAAAVHETARYKEIAASLRLHGVSSLPVLDMNRRVIGVVSEADLLDRHAARELAKGTIRLAWQLRQWSVASTATAADLMTTPAVTIRPDEPIAEAARLMQDRGLRLLPVTDRQGRLAGAVSRADVLSIAELPGEDIGDQLITQVITGRFGLNPRAFSVAVSSGAVTIAGPMADPAEAMRLIGAI